MFKVKLSPPVAYRKPIKILEYGPQHSGKTLSALYLAVGFVMKKRGCTEEEAWKHIYLLGSEYGRGALYNQLGPYNYQLVQPPYHPKILAEAFAQLNQMDEIDVVIIDSLTHYWAKEGGILDMKQQKDKLGGNSYTNWAEFTALFNKVLDGILQSPKHVIATTRSKNDTALKTDTGKAIPKTHGLKPEMREGIEYEFDIVFNIDKESHRLLVDKGVPGMELMYDMATPQFGMELMDLFDSGTVVPKRELKEIRNSIKKAIKANDKLQFVQLKLSGRKLDTLNEAELLQLEKDLLEEIKKDQIKKK